MYATRRYERNGEGPIGAQRRVWPTSALPSQRGRLSFADITPMHLRRIFLVALLGLAPTAMAQAQRGIMGGRGALPPGRGPGGFQRSGGVQLPKYTNAVNLLIEHRQDLALSDSQFVRFIAAKRSLDSTNAPLLRKLDSVQRLFKNGGPLFSAPSQQRRDSLAEAHAFVGETMATVRENISAARDSAFGFLSSVQLTRARELEAKAEKVAAEENQRAEGRKT
jgi:hypothetical protein